MIFQDAFKSSRVPRLTSGLGNLTISNLSRLHRFSKTRAPDDATMMKKEIRFDEQDLFQAQMFFKMLSNLCSLHCLSPKLRKEILSDQKMSSTLNRLSYPPRPSSNTKMAAAAVQIREKNFLSEKQKIIHLVKCKTNMVWQNKLQEKRFPSR